ncbi:hypothetical protein BH11PLA2_BH11PLA2_40200 [soil metagenome]
MSEILLTRLRTHPPKRFRPDLVRLESRLNPSFSINSTGTDGDLSDGIPDTGIFDKITQQYKGLSGIVTLNAALGQASANQSQGKPADTISFGVSGPFSSITAPSGWSVTGSGGLQIGSISVSGGGSITGITFGSPANLSASGAGGVISSVAGAGSVTVSGGSGVLNSSAQSISVGAGGFCKGSTVGTGGIESSGDSIEISGNTLTGGFITGNGNTLKIADNKISGSKLLSVIRVDGFGAAVSDVTITHNSVTNSVGGIALNNVVHSTIDSNTVAGFTQNGIDLITTADVSIFGNTVSGGTGSASSGINIQGQFSNALLPFDVVQGNTVINNKFAGIRGLIVPGLTVTANTVTGNVFGITIADRTDSSVLTDFKINDNLGQSILLQMQGKNDFIECLGNSVENLTINFEPNAAGGIANVKIEDNQIGATGGTGIISLHLVDESATVKNNTAKDSISVSVDAATSITVTGNSAKRLSVNGSPTAGIRNTISDNKLDGTGMTFDYSGLSVFGDRYDITGNTITNVMGHGVSLNGNDNTLTKNTITNSGYNGIAISGDGNVIGSSVGSNDATLGNTISFSGKEDANQGNGILVYVGIHNTFRQNHIFKNKRLGIDLGANYFDRYKQTFQNANNGIFHPTILGVKPSTNQIRWMLNASPNTDYKIDFYADAGNGFTDYAEGETQAAAPITVTTDPTGHVEFIITATQLATITATATDTLGDTSEFSLADNDADGLADVWETKGIDLDGDGTMETTLPGAKRDHKDLFVEVDSMTGYAPKPDVLEHVIRVFGRAANSLVNNPDGADGILLHAQKSTIGIAAAPLGQNYWQAYHDIKDKYFGPSGTQTEEGKARLLAYRYCLFAQTRGLSSDPNTFFSSGEVENFRSNDFMVTLGAQQGFYLNPADNSKFVYHEGYDKASPEVFAAIQSGTFMHEFGHALGLAHNGPTRWDNSVIPPATGDDNYLSVMNYAYQFPGAARTDRDPVTNVVTTHSHHPILNYSSANPADWNFLWFAFQESPGSQAGADILSPNSSDAEESDVLPPLLESEAELVAVASGPIGAVAVNAPTTLTFAVQNLGRIAATSTKFTLPLPAGISFVSATSSVGSVTFAGNSVETTVGTLEVNQQAQITIVVMPTTVGVYSLSSDAATTATEPYTGNNGADLTLEVLTTVPPPPPPMAVNNQFSVGRDRGGPASVALRNPDNTLRYSLTPFGESFTGGIRTASGDVNGDGIADLIVASGPGMPGQVLVFDGVTQKQIPTPLPNNQPFGNTFTRGIIVAAGDMNNDGLADLIITAEAGGGARVRIFQSNIITFTQRSDFIALIGGDNVPDSKIFRGGSRATVSDINGDGYGDLIWAAGAGGGPRIATFNGKLINSGSNVGFKLTGDFFALSTSLRDGAYIAGGDVNGDGIGDLIAGGGSGAPPQVVGFSGGMLMQNNFSKFLDFTYGNPNTRQGIRVAVKDINQDNIADLILGSAPTAGSHVIAFNGKNLNGSATGSAIFEYDAFPGFTGGVFVG